MPATNVTELFIETKPLWVGKVAASGVVSEIATEIPSQTTAGLTNGNVYVVTANRVNAAGTVKNPANQRETFIGKVSGNSFINCVRQVEGQAQAWDADTVLEVLFTAAQWNKLIEGIELEHNATGTHKIDKLDALRYAADAGASDTYAITLAPVPSGYYAGMSVIFKANTANTGAATLNVNTLGAKDIKKYGSSGLADLDDNDIRAGQVCQVIYDGTRFILQMVPPAAPVAAGAQFWTDVPGTPTRVSDTQFTITDTANANKYDLLFKKGVILKWDEGGTFQTAMVISSSYSSNVVTINIVGDSLTAGFTAMKYAIQKAMKETFIIPGTIAAGTDISKTWYPSSDVYIISQDTTHKTAGTTNATVYDMNVNGTTKFTTKPSVASGATTDLDNVADSPSTPTVAGSAVTADCDSVSTTAPVEAYLDLFYYPVDWRYR